MNQRMIAPAFIISILSGLGFCVAYVVVNDPIHIGHYTLFPALIQGLLLMGAFGGMGVAMILWAKHLMPTEEVEQHRHTIPSTDAEQQTLFDMVGDEAKDIGRRRVLVGLGLGSLGAIGLATLFPLKSLGPNPGNSLFRTDWATGKRLMTHDRRLVRPDDLVVGGILTVFPATEPFSNEPLSELPLPDSAATLLIKVEPERLKLDEGRKDWVVGGNIAYSKVCVHVGCPVGLYQEATALLLCPCHQSTFDVLNGGEATFGPATRPLPQLPLAVDAEGYLIAQSDYREPVGPAFWNRGRRQTEA